MKEKITKSEYLQLVGVLALAESHRRVLEDCRQTLATMLDARDVSGSPNGHIDDAVYGERSGPEEMIRLMKITVEN